jgi:hypothetical protein
MLGLAAGACDKRCTKIYEPVCAGDDVTTKTFSNACILDLYNCENPENRKLQILSDGIQSTEWQVSMKSNTNYLGNVERRSTASFSVD